jgi:Flp pilus assembly protein TadD
VRTLATDRNLILIVFVVALTVRLIYLSEYRSVPYFDSPFGDSSHYQKRAEEIVSGDILGTKAYFLGSPLYPYFMAAVYKPFGVNFTLIRIIQILIGGLTCVLIYLLTRAIFRKNRHQAFVAGLLAAGYGTMAFYDGTLLMTTLELFFVCGSLLLLISSQRLSDGLFLAGGTAFASGVCLGLAGLGRPNILVFAPFGLLWIFSGFGKSFLRNRWCQSILFALGCVLAVLPISIRNHVVSDDFVLVSSSFGINLFIGNNAEANGFLSLPSGSDLEVFRLYESSRAAAQTATGDEDMKPSEVSGYWASRAFDFIAQHPGETARLLLKKVRLFWNHYEIPNLHNKYYIASTYAPSLRWMIVGFGFIAPLALIGILLELRKRPVPPSVKLCLGFLGIYMCSVVPFFVTARYRIIVVPLLTVFAAAGLWNLAELVKKRRFGWLITAITLGVGAGVWVNRTVIESNYWFSHAIVGTTYAQVAQKRPEQAASYLGTAVVELKKAIELSPNAPAPRYYLGVVYQQIGFHSGAIDQFEAALEHQPTNRPAREAMKAAQSTYESKGDEIDIESIPLTPLESAARLQRDGNIIAAESELRRALQEDPQHARAHNDLGIIYLGRNKFDKAIAQYKKGLRYAPDNPVVLHNLAYAYYRTRDFENARRYWERCLEITPDDEDVIKALKTLPAR